jgi:putative hemolysin
MPEPVCNGGTRPGRLVVRLATTDAEVEAAQRLRYRVFAEECGAIVPSMEAGLDRDAFDDACEHLVLWDVATGEAIGTYRVLSQDRARRLGGFYSAGEFDLGALPGLANLVEVGRSCVDPRHRTGVAVATLLGGLAALVRERGWQYVIGCASVHVPRGGEASVARLVARLAEAHAAPPGLRVRPRTPFAAAVRSAARPARIPPLVRAYLRMGAWVCGPAAWDEAFRTADLLLLLPMARMSGRLAERLLRAA